MALDSPVLPLVQIKHSLYPTLGVLSIVVECGLPVLDEECLTTFVFSTAKKNLSANTIRSNISKTDSQQNVRNIKSLQHLKLTRRSYTGFQNALSFHNITDETLEGLSDFFDEMSDNNSLPSTDYDVQFGDGVLTVQFGGKVGTYVINKQTPNQQIWLSSPQSGPKRYDFIDNKWIYKHDQVSLHELLSREMSSITGQNIDLTHLPYGGRTISTKEN